MKLFHGLRFKIFILIILVGTVPATCLVPLSLWSYKTISIRSDGQDMLAQSLVYNNQIITTGYYAGDQNQQLQMELFAMAESYHGRFMLINSSLKVVKDSYGVDEGKTVVWKNVIDAAKGKSSSYYDEDNQYLIITTPLTKPSGEVVGVIIINKSMDYIASNMDSFVSYALIALVIIYILSVVLAFVFSTLIQAPLRRTSDALDDIGNEYRNDLPLETSYREITAINVKTNEILSKLHAIDESRQEFVSNVSHELKTPLTSMKVLADSLNGGGDVPLEMYKEFMQDIGNEIDRETKIINDLLALVRMDKSKATLDVSAVNMNELVELILKRLKPIAETAQVDVLFETFRPVICEIDEVKFTLAITNLVENGIKYNEPGGWVHVSLNSDHKYCYIKVEDNGLGIPEESVDHIFERFYRADKSHSRAIGGTGLGLAITKSAVVMHKGDIKVHSRLGEGTTFDVRVPLNYIAEEGK